MPINLQNPENVATGWAPEPKLEAANIGPLVSAILASRLGQQKLTQDTISEAIKAQQARQQAGMFGTALQNEGLVSPGTDLSGMSSTDLARLVQARLEQTPDTEMDEYHSAAAAKERAMADWISKNKPLAGPDTDGTDTTGEDTRQNPVTGAWEYRTVSARGVVNWHPYPVGMQPRNVRTTGPLPAAQEPEEQLRTKYNLDPEELYQWSPEYGMATLDAKGQPDPTTFNASAPGSGAQPFVRVTKADGGQVVMPRATYERFKGQVMPEAYYGGQGQAQPSASPSPTATPRPNRPNASTGAPVNLPAPNKPVTKGEQIDPATVQQYILKNNGDRDAAREDARRDGWSF